MSEVLNDLKALEGRKPLVAENIQVPLRDQIPQKLLRKLKDMGIGEKIKKSWDVGIADRGAWLERQRVYLKGWDEFLESTSEGPFDGASTLHLPTVFIVVKTLHARFLQAVLEGDPVVKARNEASLMAAPMIQELMGYTLNEWCNHRRGIAESLDVWLWDWVTVGSAVLKLRWDRKFEKYVDVQPVPRLGPPKFFRDAFGIERSAQTVVVEDKEVEVTNLCYEGPCFAARRHEDVLILGGDGDPQMADSVTDAYYLTASELWSLADQGVFDSDVVDEIIKSGPDEPGNKQWDAIKQDRAVAAGKAATKGQSEADRYLILEDYRGVPVDNTGINSEVVTWVHYKTAQIARATYLRRISKAGERPFFKIDFHKRPGQEWGIGIPELLHPISVEMDAMHNLRIDFGMISNMPIGFYRASSSLNPETIRYRPGDLIPLDDPTRDIVFPNMGNRTSFGFQEEQALQTFVERLTGINDLSAGVMTGAQGATRTATGARALIGEQNANLDVHLRRLNRGWKQALEALLHMLQQRMPKGFEYRVTADTGDDYFRRVRPEDIAGDYDFELSPNSSNTNRAIQQQDAQEALQLVLNPLLIQTGIVQVPNIYEALKDWARAKNMKNFNRLFTKPAGYQYVPNPSEEFYRILLGQEVPVLPNADHQGFLDLWAHVQQTDDIFGYFDEQAVLAAAAQAQKHQAMLQALQAQEAQAANLNQQRMNSSFSQAQAPVGMQPMAGTEAQGGV